MTGLNVEPGTVGAAATQFGAAVQSHAQVTAQHHASFGAAVSRWTGSSSSQALQQGLAALQVRHAAHQQRVRGIASGASAAAQNYAITDE